MIENFITVFKSGLNLAIKFCIRIFVQIKVRIFGKFLYRNVLFNQKTDRQNEDADLPREIEILSPFYGEIYRNMFADTCLPSLLQSGIDQLCPKIPTQLSIHCPRSDWETIKNQVSICVGNLPIEVRWFPLELPEGQIKNQVVMPFVRSRVQSTINQDQLIVFAFPDHIFGKGLDRAILNTSRGEYVVCISLRTPSESGANFYKTDIKENRYRNCDLVKYALEMYVHPLVRQAFEDKHDYLHFKKQDGGYLGYFCEPPPLLMWGSADIFHSAFHRPFYGEKGLLECLDHDIPNLMLKHHRLRVINDSEYFCWLELTPESRYIEMITSRFNLESSVYLRNVPLRFSVSNTEP